MIEQLLSFFTMILGLQIQEDTYYGSWVQITGYVDDFEKQINIQEIQKSIIIEDYFLFTERLGRINYARWCAGEATPPDRNWNRCGMKSFDCWGMMKYFWYIKGILQQSDMKYLKSKTLYELWEPKDPRTAERWDFMYWEAMSTGNDATHFAVIYSGYNDQTHTITIRDAADPKHFGKIWAREISVSCNAIKCWYMWKYRIYISSNGMVEVASKRGIQVNAFKIVDNTDEK